MAQAYLSTAYLAPIQSYCKLIAYDTIVMEAEEHYIKQSYRNRCTITAANGIQSLSIPIEKPKREKCPTKEIRISDHGRWRQLHWQTLVSAYGKSPFFEYYQDDFVPFYEKRYSFLLDYNEALRQLVCELIDIQPLVTLSTHYEAEVAHDYRRCIHPKKREEDNTFSPSPYYQQFSEKQSFQPNLSIVDLLFNMGPESIFVLRGSIREPALPLSSTSPTTHFSQQTPSDRL